VAADGGDVGVGGAGDRDGIPSAACDIVYVQLKCDKKTTLIIYHLLIDFNKIRPTSVALVKMDIRRKLLCRIDDGSENC